jgi:hypothetical protein
VHDKLTGSVLACQLVCQAPSCACQLACQAPSSVKWMVVAQRQADGTFKVEKGHTFNVEPSLAAVPTN